MADVDLRRAARMALALHESDYDALHLVMIEVQREHRWRDLAMALLVITRMLAIDEPLRPDPADTDAFALWLHGAVEQIAADGDAWWLQGLD